VQRRARVVIRLTVYSRPGCHLCDVMKAVVERAVRTSDLAVSIEDIDISGDPDLEARYGIEVPVLMIDGKKAAKYRVSEWDVRRMLASRTAGGGGKAGGRG
jgi:hypothetical protein